MTPEFFKYAYLAVLAFAWAVRGYYAAGLVRTGAGRERGPAVDTVFLVLAFVAFQVLPLVYIFTPWLSFADYRPGAAGMAGVAGVAAGAAGVALLGRSHADLGRNWSVRPGVDEGQTLVTHGSYRYIRHPMYAAHLLLAISQALCLWNWIAGPSFLAVFVPLYLIRVGREEKMLLDHFGPDYRDYMARTGRLIPRLRRPKG